MAGVKGYRLPAGCEAAFFLWCIQSNSGGGSRGHGGVKRLTLQLTEKRVVQERWVETAWRLLCHASEELNRFRSIYIDVIVLFSLCYLSKYMEHMKHLTEVQQVRAKHTLTLTTNLFLIVSVVV